MNEYLSTLGLCLRAGKLTAGLEAVCDCVSQSGDVRLVLLSADAGESTVRRVRRAAEGKSMPIVRLGANAEDIGAALGRGACAVCCIHEIGFAAEKTARDWFAPMPGAIVAELTEEVSDAVRIGATTAEKTISLGSDEASISELLALNDAVLESVYPTKTQSAGAVESLSY